MSAHPAGPRHEYPHAPTIGERPDDADALMALDAHVWPQNAKRETSGAVSFAGIDVNELAKEYGTPLFVVDEDDFRSRCRELAAAFGGGERVHYASKAFLCTEVAKWIKDEGLALDVASGGELAIALRADFPTERITMHGNNKSPAELDLAVRSGVGHIVLDAPDEIDLLDEVAKDHGVKQEVFLRVTVGVEAHTHEFIATAHEDQKFGFSLAGGKALAAVGKVLEAENLVLTGLHSHIGSQIFEFDGFELAARRVVGLMEEIRSTYGADAIDDITTVDLGGGLGISYVPTDNPPEVKDLADMLIENVEKQCADAGIEFPTVVVEPGRAIAGPGTVTVYEIGAVKDVELSDGQQRRYLSVDGGMSDNVRTALYDATYTARLVGRSSDQPPVVSRLVGKHCESGDVVVRDLWLPGDVGRGDLVAVAATGAYCYSMSSRYNLVGRPALIAVRDGKARLVLRRETFDDLIGLEVDEVENP